MRRAHLRYLDGTVRVIEIFGYAGDPWPHVIKHADPVLHPIIGQVIDVDTVFHVDRASFDPDRDWQNYAESDA